MNSLKLSVSNCTQHPTRDQEILAIASHLSAPLNAINELFSYERKEGRKEHYAE